MLPACGQGALGIECRVDDHALKARLKPLHDPVTALCVQTEREVNAHLGGGCHTPLAVYCKPMGANQLILCANVASTDGTRLITNTQQGPTSDASSLALSCATALLAQGAASLLERSPQHDA